MEWLGNGASIHPGEESNSDPASTPRTFSDTSRHQQSHQRCVKASIISSWRLAEAQDQLCSLGVHNSESLEQERARTLTCPTELTHTEDEWRRKESMLGGQEPSRSPVLGAVGSWDVFDKSIINVQNQPVERDQDKCKTFLQKYEQKIRHFGMLRRWDDSQRFLADTPQLICEETANYLILWCMRLQQEGKEALMEQVAHQAVVMQFILEMASNSQQDPRGCFRQFFHKAKDGQDIYLEVFCSELEAFKHRVKEYAVNCRGDSVNNAEHNTGTNCRLQPKEALDSLPPATENEAPFPLMASHPDSLPSVYSVRREQPPPLPSQRKDGYPGMQSGLLKPKLGSPGGRVSNEALFRGWIVDKHREVDKRRYYRIGRYSHDGDFLEIV